MINYLVSRQIMIMINYLFQQFALSVPCLFFFYLALLIIGKTDLPIKYQPDHFIPQLSLHFAPFPGEFCIFE
jgi:hypothetical protein